MSRIRSSGLIVAGLDIGVGGRGRGRPTRRRARHGRSVCRPSWRAEAQSSSQVVSTPPSISRRGCSAMPSASKARERRPSARSGSSTIGDALGEDRARPAVLEEGRAARDRGPADRARRDGGRCCRRRAGRTPPARAWLFDLARVEPARGALGGAGGRASAGSGRSAARITRGELVVALHRAVGAGDHGGAEAVARARARADEAVGGRERRAAARPVGLGAFGVGDRRDGRAPHPRPRRRAAARASASGSTPSSRSSSGRARRDLLGLGEAGIAVLGHGPARSPPRARPGGRGRARRARRSRRSPAAGRRTRAGRDRGSRRARPSRACRGRRVAASARALDEHRVGGIGAGFPGPLQKVAQQV